MFANLFNPSPAPLPATEVVAEPPVLHLRGAGPLAPTDAATALPSSGLAAPAGDDDGARLAAAGATATLSALGEFEAVAADEADVPFMTMASVRGGLLAAGAAPTVNEFVAVVDVSGSMDGEKIELAKQALMFVVEKGLDSADAFALVAFGTSVSVELPFVTMNPAGKRAALDAIKRLRIDGQTNLSGGLLGGLDLLAQRARAEGRAAHGVTRSVVLFTDGAANQGITDASELVAVAAAQMPAIGAAGCALFTFGFGSDHQEDLLRALSQVTPDGQYFFIDDADKICLAFAEVLGGLKSVVAQNAELTATLDARAAAAGVVIARVLGGDAYAHALAADGASLTIRLGDLYAEDEKDLLVELRLPRCAAPAAEPAAVVEWSLRFFDVQARGFATARATVAVARPALAAPQTTPARLVEERTRLRATEAIALATAAADKGEYGHGRELLQRARALCEADEVGASPMMRALAADLEGMATGFAGEVAFKSAGRKQAHLSAQAYGRQRSALGSAAVYAKSARREQAASAANWMAQPHSQ